MRLRVPLRTTRLKGLFFYRWVFKSLSAGIPWRVYPHVDPGNPKFIHIGNEVHHSGGCASGSDPGRSLQIPEMFYWRPGVNIEQNVKHLCCRQNPHQQLHVGIGAQCDRLLAVHTHFSMSTIPTKISARIGGVGSVTEVGDYCFMGVNDVIQMNVKLGKVCRSRRKYSREVECSGLLSVVEGQSPLLVILAYNKEERQMDPARKETLMGLDSIAMLPEFLEPDNGYCFFRKCRRSFAYLVGSSPDLGSLPLSRMPPR